MALRKIKTVRVGSCQVDIRFNREFDEYVVHTTVNGKREGGRDGGYFTVDRGDARSTAAAILRRLRKRPACRRGG